MTESAITALSDRAALSDRMATSSAVIEGGGWVMEADTGDPMPGALEPQFLTDRDPDGTVRKELRNLLAEALGCGPEESFGQFVAWLQENPYVAVGSRPTKRRRIWSCFGRLCMQDESNIDVLARDAARNEEGFETLEARGRLLGSPDWFPPQKFLINAAISSQFAEMESIARRILSNPGDVDEAITRTLDYLRRKQFLGTESFTKLCHRKIRWESYTMSERRRRAAEKLRRIRVAPSPSAEDSYQAPEDVLGLTTLRELARAITAAIDSQCADGTGHRLIQGIKRDDDPETWESLLLICCDATRLVIHSWSRLIQQAENLRLKGVLTGPGIVALQWAAQNQLSVREPYFGDPGKKYNRDGRIGKRQWRYLVAIPLILMAVLDDLNVHGRSVNTGTAMLAIHYFEGALTDEPYEKSKKLLPPIRRNPLAELLELASTWIKDTDQDLQPRSVTLGPATRRKLGRKQILMVRLHVEAPDQHGVDDGCLRLAEAMRLLTGEEAI